MTPDFSLAHLTVLSLPPPEVIAVAARLGYRHAGLRLLPASPGGPAYRLMDDPAMLREPLARMADTGVTVFDLEIIRLDQDFDANAYLPFFEVGAKAMLVAGDDRDEARLTASFVALCDAAEPFGLTADLEFMPWTAVPSLRSALRIVAAAGRPNGGVLVDTLHFARSDSQLDELEAVPREWLHYAQLYDAPTKCRRPMPN